MPFSNKSVVELAKLSEEEVINIFESSKKGLSQEEAARRLKNYGYNQISESKRLNAFLKFLSGFKSPLVIILLVAALASAVFGEILDALIIAIMIFLSVALDFFLEYNAQKASDKLKDQVQTKASVIRNGKTIEVGYANLCEGDVIFLNAGSLIPADARIISSTDFFVNQSSLTGESFPCEKTSNALGLENISITDLHNIVFLGTSVVSGSAQAIVIKTGQHTEFGKIATQLASKEEETEFSRGIHNFSYMVMKAIIFLVLFIFLINSLLKHDILQSFLFALAVAVGITPEFLPMIMSVTMAKGSTNMAKKGVIVKKLSSIPNFGSMDVLCTDKTGTLTEDKIKLVNYSDIFGKHSEQVLLYAYLNSYYETGIKNPLDEAVLEYKDFGTVDFKKVDEIPFDFVRKKMSVVVRNKKKITLITKGAPEEIFSSSKYYEVNRKKLLLTENIKQKAIQQYHDLSNQGFRVLAVAVKEIGEQKKYSKANEVELILLGFVSFLDPPKEDAKEVVEALYEMGVDIKIITGDNEFVTKKICDEIGIPIKGIMLGADIRTMTDDALRVRIETTSIFARFSPDEKNRVIHALRANGHVVGYMGDGINDAPSLVTADIGISVSTAVDVAKESADIVLTKKSLKVLREGIIDGRITFGNTMKYIMMNISSNFGNMFSVAGAVLFLPFLPMLPIQILLNNFIYDFSQITIPGDKVDKNFIQRPKRWNIKFIKKFMFLFGPISSLFDFLSFFLLYSVFHFTGSEFQTGWFLESLATQTLIIHIIRTKELPFVKSNASKWLIFSSIFCVALGWMIPYTPLGEIFGFTPLPWTTLLAIIGIIVFYMITVEIAKRIFYRHNDF